MLNPGHVAEHHPHEVVHGWRRVLRWLLGIGVTVVALIALTVGGALIFLATDSGRDFVRGKVEAALQKEFPGGAKIGKVEGLFWGEVVVRGLEIDGPDHRPAIYAGTARARVGLLPLVHKHVEIEELALDDVDVSAKRDADGKLELAELTAPPDDTDQSPSTWTVDLPGASVHHGFLMVDTGTPQAGLVHLDDVTIDANAKLPAGGAGVAAGLKLAGTWRERGAPVAVAARVSDEDDALDVPDFAVAVGDVSVAGHGVTLRHRGDKTPIVTGAVRVVAPREALAHLAGIELPEDVAVVISATAPGGADAHVETIALVGALGGSPVSGQLLADLDAERATADLTAGSVELAPLTAGKVSALATAKVHAQVVRTNGAITLEGAHVALAIPKSRGQAPVQGTLDAVLDAAGPLSPTPDLRVVGKIDGQALHVQDLSIASLAVAIDEAHLPAQPVGETTVHLTDVVRGTMQFRQIDLGAGSRADGKIQVELSSHPAPAPWLVELSALVTPPGRNGGTLLVDLQRHHVRANNGMEWQGTGGRVTMTDTQIQLADLHSHSATGNLAAAATYTRAGAGAGNLTANVDVDGFALATLRPDYRGAIAAHVDVARRALLWSGDVRMAGRQLALGAQARTVDLDAVVTARPGTVTATATATPLDAGAVKVALDLAAPEHLDDIAAWKRRGRDAIRTLELDADHVNIARATDLVPAKAQARAESAKAVAQEKGKVATQPEALAQDQLPERPSGLVDGKLVITATTATGQLRATGVHAAQLRGLGTIDATLDLAQPAPGELDPTLNIQVADLGHAIATARVSVPQRMFDAAAWQRIGLGALRGATVRTDPIVVDPALLARFGLTSTLRGKVQLALDVDDGARAAKLTVTGDDVRGTPVAEPVSIRLDAGFDGKTATCALAMTAQGTAVTMLKLDAKVPATLEQLRAHPEAARSLPISATLEIPQTSAPRLLAVFGRSQLTGGTITGKVDVTGTLGDPTVAAHIVGDGLAVPAGTHGQRIQTVQEVVIDGSWKQQHGKVQIHGTEDRGGTLALVADIDPNQLAAATASLEAHTFDLSPLLALAPGPASDTRGSLDAKLAITGFDPRTAKVLGELHLHDAHVPIAPTVGTLRQAEIDIAITQHDIQLNAKGKLGAGDLQASGSIALDGVNLDGGQAKLTLRKVSPIGAVEPQIDADITAKISRKNATWIADVVVDHGFVKVTKTSGEKLKPVGLPPDLTIGNARDLVQPAPKPAWGPPPPPPAPILTANVVIHPVKVEAQQFRSTIAGNLSITADADAVGMVGTISAQSGDLDLFGRRYRVEQAAVTFDGTIDPMLAVRITYDFPDVETITVVRGRLSKPKLELSANPGLYTESQLLGFLLGGEPNGSPMAGSARDKAAEEGASLIANQIGSYVKQALPFDIDVIKYEAASVTSSAAITVGSWVTHTLFVAFRTHPDALPNENSGEGEIEYWINRKLELQGTAGDRNYDQFNVLWRKRF